jgi:hypothetical protein
MGTNNNKKIEDFVNELKESSFFRTMNLQENRNGIYYADIKFARYTQIALYCTGSASNSPAYAV